MAKCAQIMALCLISLVFIWFCVSQELEYELVKADTRNILFVGRGRSGKTTLIEVLKDVNYSPGEMDILRGTKGASVATFTMESKKLNNNLHFNIMDSPGLFERTLDKKDKRTNEVILDIIKKCIDLEITKVHHVYFVMSIAQGLNPNDLKAFKLFSELFVGMEDKLSVIISFSQDKVEADYGHYRDQFKNVPDLKDLYQTIQGRIFFLGAAAEMDVYDMKMIKANVALQRATLFEHIIQQNESYNVKELKIYKDNLSLITRVKTTLH